jgi:methylthioribose-1-phosphate isomerase
MGSEEKIKIAMMSAASKALSYKKINPKAETDEILQYVMTDLKVKGQEKIGAMAAAGKALKYKEESSDLTDKKIMQKVMDESNDILMTMSLD